MRRILAAIRRIVAAMAVPVLAFIDGAWRIVRSFGPQPSTALEDAADEAVDEAVDEASRPGAREAFEARKAELAAGEENRVRRAAQAILRREPVPIDALDPSLAWDARLLEWLKGLNVEELATVVQMRPDRLTQHLDDRPGAPLPPVRKPIPADDVVVEMKPAEPAMRRRAA